MTEMLDPSKPTYVLCHHGMRSYRAATFLASQVGAAQYRQGVAAQMLR